MTDRIWACNINHDANFGWYQPWFGGLVDEKERLRRSGRMAALNRVGKPWPANDYPQQTLATRGAPKGGQHLVACENRNILVSDRIAELLSGFDLGEGGFAPSQIVKRDTSRAVHALGFEMNYWRLGARKKTLVPGQSRGVTQVFNAATGITPESGIEVWSTPPWLDISAGDLAFSPAALDGPDVWVEQGMSIDLFISDRLAQALRKAKLDNRFALKSCRVVAGPGDAP